MSASRTFTLLLQMPPGGTVAGSKFTAPYDSTAGMPAIYYWFAAGFLLFIVLGVVKVYRDDKQWDGKFMDILSNAKKIQDEYRIVVRGHQKPTEPNSGQGNPKKF